MTDVHAGDLPLCITSRCHAAVVIVHRRSPEVRHRNFSDHLFSRIAVGNQTAVQQGKQAVKIITFHANIDFSADYL